MSDVTLEDLWRGKYYDKVAELVVAEDKLRLAIKGLESIVAKSHSWLITEETGYIEKPIHDSYRSLAKDILLKLKG